MFKTGINVVLIIYIDLIMHMVYYICMKKKQKGENKMTTKTRDLEKPAIYVGTYKKYNNGSIQGAWFDLTKFDCLEDFIEACEELHDDEDDPELMYQDFENFPKEW